MYTFKKNERLYKKRTINLLFSEGKSLSNYPFKLIWRTEPCFEQQSFRILISVSKKSFKKAVIRNRIKRQIRETFRLNKSLLIDFIQDAKIDVSIAILYIDNKTIETSILTKKIIQLFYSLRKELTLELKYHHSI